VDADPVAGYLIQPYGVLVSGSPSVCSPAKHSDLHTNAADRDVMQVAGAFVGIPPLGPSSHDQCCCCHEQQNGSGVDDPNHRENHAVKTDVRAAGIIPQRKREAGLVPRG